MKKRLLNLILVLVMIVCVLPFAASAAECEHDYSEFVYAYPKATCTTDGQGWFKCSHCGEGAYQTIPAGHTPEVIPAVEATCTTAGLTAGEKCSVCGEVTKAQETVPAAHDFTGAETMVRDPSCKAFGLKDTQCTRCDEKVRSIIAKVPHTVVEIAEIPATCTEAGATAGKWCSVCDATLEGRDAIAALDHKFISDPAYLVKTIREPSCKIKNEVGRGEFKCIRCDQTGQLNIPCVDCNIVEVPGVEPTCTKEGWTAGKQCESCGTVTEYCQKIEKLRHSYDDGVVTTAPACGKEGVKTFTCTRPGCGSNYPEAIPALKHEFDNGTVTTEPVCGKEGVKTFKCIHEGCKVSKTEPIEKLRHVYDDGVVTTAPACGKEGVKTFTCTLCGSHYTEVIPGLKHEFDNGTVTTEPVCGKEGVKTFKCIHEGCKVSKTEPIAMLHHEFDEGVVTTEATCTADGVKTFTCIHCGITPTEKIDALGHDYTVDMGYRENEAPTCQREGIRVLGCSRCDSKTAQTAPKIPCEPEEWTGYAPTCETTGRTNGEKCKYCKAVLTVRQEIPALGHSLKLDFASTEPTCTEKGWGKYVCERENCNHSETSWVDALGHDYVEQEKWDATCTKDGITEIVCSHCSTMLRERIPATDHTEEVVPGVEATCTATGLTEGKKCATCNAVLVAQEEIAKKDHAWVEKTGESATCTKDGFTAYKECSVCGLTEGKEVIKAGHTFVEGSFKCTVCDAADPMCEHQNAKIETIAATCTAAGKETFNCEACGYHFEETLPKIAHQTVVQSSAATCTAKGETCKVCTLCNQVVERIEIPMLAHNYRNGACSDCGSIDPNYSGSGTPGAPTTPAVPSNPGTSGCQHDKSTVTHPATCTMDGYEIVTCTTCNKVVSKKLLPALGHTNTTSIQEPTCTKNGVKIVKCDRCDTFDYEILPATGRHNYVKGICSTCGGADPNRFTADFQDVQLVGGSGY